MSARYEIGGNADIVNPLIIIIRGVVNGHELTWSSSSSSSSREQVCIIILRRYRCMRARCDGKTGSRWSWRTKGQSSFAGSFLPYYPYLAVRLTRHAYKAVFIVVTGQRVALVRDLSRRGEVEREYSSKSQNINRSTCRRSVASVATQRETSARRMRSVRKILRPSERGLSAGSSRDHHFTFVTPLCHNCRSKSWFLIAHWLSFGNALLKKKKLRSERIKLFTETHLLLSTQLIFS